MTESHDTLPEAEAYKSLLHKTPEDSSGKSLLDRPLHMLTEDDIAQLTREDCRRYLKEKGMRRPSWNKSQAIQQVIMLKKLLEADREVGSPKRPNYVGYSSNDAAKDSVPKVKSRDAEISVSVKERTPLFIGDLNKPDPSEASLGSFTAAKDESTQSRTIGTIDIAAGQMTIFYGGEVNVYDDMPADKARTIMHIAASPLEFPEEQLNHSKPLPGFPKGLSMKMVQNTADVNLPRLQIVNTRDNSLMLGEENIMLLEGTPVEGPPFGRKASVQRYLEKKKDRFKSKRKSGLTSCASLDLHFNYQISNQITTIDSRSPTQSRQPSTPTRCSSLENDSLHTVCVSTGVSNKGL